MNSFLVFVICLIIGILAAYALGKLRRQRLEDERYLQYVKDTLNAYSHSFTGKNFEDGTSPNGQERIER